MNVRRVVLALASLLLLAQAVPSFASARIVRLSYLDGDVKIDRNKAAGVERAILNMPVVEGTRIISEGDDARVEIEFENGSTLRLAGPADILFRELGLGDDGAKHTAVEMLYGTGYFDIKLHDNDDYRVLFQDRDLQLRKSSHFRVRVEEERATLAVYRGQVELAGEANRVLVNKQETLSLENGDTRYFLARDVEPMVFDDFDHERDEYREAYAKSDAYNHSGVSYGDPYSYGLNDMAYYGNYAYYPGYGYLWRPAGYGINWDPFSQGAWSYYPQFGWVYVSSYPWGWTPYRYGQWTWVPGYGWCWNPSGYGGHGGGWYPVPRYRPPTHVGHGPIPVPVVRPPHDQGGRTLLIGNPEPREEARRPNPAGGPGRPGRRNVGNDPDHPPVGSQATGPAAATPTAPAAGTPVGPASGYAGGGGTVTPTGGAVGVQGGGAVGPVVPGLRREPDDPARRQQPHRYIREDAPSTPPVAQPSQPTSVMPTAPPIRREPEMRHADPAPRDPAPRATPTPPPPSAPPPTRPPQSSRGVDHVDRGGGRAPSASSGFSRGNSGMPHGNSGGSHAGGASTSPKQK